MKKLDRWDNSQDRSNKVSLACFWYWIVEHSEGAEH